MRNFTFKGLFLAAMFMVLGSLAIQAADNDGLITKQIIVKLEKAGTLPDRIGSTKRNKITNLKIIGEINGTDWRVIREMAGRSYYNDGTDGKLAILDLSEAKIVSGGGSYLYNDSYTNDNELGSCAFLNCSGLTSLSLPSSLTSIKYRAFYGCSGLTSLSLPSGITSIDWNAFSGCSGLTSLTLPSSLTSIDSGAFSGCSGLTSLSLPSGLTSIGDGAFRGCSGLTSIYVYTEKLPNMGSDVFDGCDAKNVLFTFQKELMMIIGFLNLVILRTS